MKYLENLNTKTKMSKEQTPITAEEFLISKDVYEDCYSGGYYEWIEEKSLYDIMEQYAQTKVLEFAEWEQSNTEHLNYSPKELVDMFKKQK